MEVVIGMNLQRLPGARADNTSGAYGAASPGKSTGLKVHNVGSGVGGTEVSLRQALAAAIDRTNLQALVVKPLPSQAQSEAYAAKAAPAVVPEITGGAPAIDPAGTATATAPASARTASTATPTPTPTPTSAPSPPTPPATDTLPVAEAVNKLRGLFGR